MRELATRGVWGVTFRGWSFFDRYFSQTAGQGRFQAWIGGRFPTPEEHDMKNIVSDP